MKTGKLLAAVCAAAAALAPPPAARASTGDIVDIRVVDTDEMAFGDRNRGAANHCTPSNPLVAGDTLYIRVRMLARNWPNVIGGVEEPETWSFAAGASDDPAPHDPPKLGLMIGERPAYAEFSEYGPKAWQKSGELETNDAGTPGEAWKLYTDLYFRYTVQPGDMGLPVMLMNSTGTGPASGGDTGTDYYILNCGPAGFWSLRSAVGAKAKLSYGPEVLPVPASKAWPDGIPGDVPVRTYDLSAEGAYVKTIDFDKINAAGDPYSEGDVWRDVYPGASAAPGTAPTLVVEGGAAAAATAVYVWSGDESVVVPVASGSNTVSTVDGKTVLKVQIPTGAESAPFSLKGADGAVADETAMVYMGPVPGAVYRPTGERLDATTSRMVRIVALPPPVVSNVVARQRWPWNGLVDVDYEIGGYTDNYWVEISFAEQGGAGRCWTATNFVGCVEPGYEPGRHRATWDTKADGVTNVVASNVVATVRLIEMPLVDAQFDGVAGHLQDLGYTVEESGGRHLYKDGAKVAELEIPAVFTSRRTHRRCRVVGVAEQAFLKCVDLEKVILPEAVTNIAKEAFAYCGLTSMEVPDGVVNIGEEAFSWCRSMSSVSLPSSLKTIGREAFYTAGLKSIEIPDSVTSIGEDAFYFCPNLKSASILGGVGTLPRMLFAECDMLESVTIGEGVKTMVEYAFYKCIRLKTVSLPESLEEIDRYVFAYDESLDDVYVPADVRSIGTDAFLNVKHITYYGSAVGAKWGADEWN